MAVGFNLPDPYEAQKAEIARRQKYAQTLEQQAFQPVETYSYQGIQAPIPATAALAKVLAGLGAGYFESQAAREQRELREGDIKKGQEFAAALQGAKTPEEKQALALRALGGELGQRAQGIAGPFFTMAETAQQKELARQAAAEKAREDREARGEQAAANRELRATIAAGQQETNRLLVGNRIDVQREGLQLRADAQRAAAERELDKLPVNVVTTYQTAATNERAAGDTAQNMLRHVEDIKTGKLPLGPFATPAARVSNYLGLSSPESVRLADLERDITAAVNTILLSAKGTQTEGDAVRARKQILDNLNDPKVVEKGLKDLAKASQEAQNIYRNTMNQLGARYRGLEHERLAPIEVAPPAGQPRPPGSAPTPPAPTPPSGQQPRPAPASGQQPAAPRRLRFNPETGNLE